MSRIAPLRLVAAGAAFAAGLAASLSLTTPAARPGPADCIVVVCVPETLPTVPLPTLPAPTEPLPPGLPLPVPTTPTPTGTTPVTTPPGPAPAGQPGSSGAPAPRTRTSTRPDRAAHARPAQAATQAVVRVQAISPGGRRTVILMFVWPAPARAALSLRLDRKTIRDSFALHAGRNVRRVRIPSRTRPGRVR